MITIYKHLLTSCCVFVFSLSYFTTYAQPTDCEVRYTPFIIGEEITYSAIYNWGLIWVNAGEVVFRVKETTYNNKPATHFESIGWSHRKYDWIFKVRDRFESKVNSQTLKPYWFERDCYEGGFESYNHYIFDRDNDILTIKSETSDRPYKIESFPLQPCVFDVVSGVYYARSINYNQYNINDKIPITVAIDDEIFDLFIRYLGKEQITTREGHVYNTIKFSVLLVEGTVFSGGEDMYVWVTDDLNRVPLLVEAKILIGSVKAVLKDFKNLKYPLTSRIR